jgi:hypothetical protein
MLLTAALLLLVTFLPGYALCRVLDASADKLRKFALAPALGLLLVYGLSGLVLLSGLWTWGLMCALLLLINTLAVTQLRTRKKMAQTLTSWQKLERAMHGEVYGTPEEAISDEVSAQRWLQNQRNTWRLALASTVILSCFTLPLLMDSPFGVDWIGFSTLTHQISSVGDLSLSGTNTGFWTYPPGFPSLAAWVQESLNLQASEAVFTLGHYSLAVLLLGIGGAMDRHGAGAYGVLSMALGAGLFAKTFDSGYPTVASQLGLVVGLLVLLRPSSTRGKHHTTGFVVAFFCVLMIHPTGATYLGMLMLAHLLIGLSLSETHGENIKKLLLTSSILLTIAAAIALVILAPRMLDAAVFAEYGWQGGRPMLMYNGILLVLGLSSAWKLRHTIEGRLLAVWFTGLWLLTSIHLIEGLEQIPVLSLLSYTLYSMGLHAFHIPLAALVALWWSQTTCLTSLDEKQNLLTVGWDPHMHRYLTAGLSVTLLLGVLFGNMILLQVSEHQELQAYAAGDTVLYGELAQLPEGSVVYTENAHWGYVSAAPPNIATTSIPTLGLIQIETSIQSNATTAVYSDSIVNLQQLNITHALSSPLGTVGWFLAQSSFWSPLVEVRGSVLWILDPTGNSDTSTFATFTESACSEGCELRPDPWSKHRFRDPLQLGASRAFIAEGNNAVLSFSTPELNSGGMCLALEAIGDLGEVTLSLSDSFNSTTSTVQFSAGWHNVCFEETINASSGTFEVEWSTDATAQWWLNPLGLSGRSEALLDSTGIRLHWLEIKTSSAE